MTVRKTNHHLESLPTDTATVDFEHIAFQDFCG